MIVAQRTYARVYRFVCMNVIVSLTGCHPVVWPTTKFRAATRPPLRQLLSINQRTDRHARRASLPDRRLIAADTVLPRRNHFVLRRHSTYWYWVNNNNKKSVFTITAVSAMNSASFLHSSQFRTIRDCNSIEIYLFGIVRYVCLSLTMAIVHGVYYRCYNCWLTFLPSTWSPVRAKTDPILLFLSLVLPRQPTTAVAAAAVVGVCHVGVAVTGRVSTATFAAAADRFSIHLRAHASTNAFSVSFFWNKLLSLRSGETSTTRKKTTAKAGV